MFQNTWSGYVSGNWNIYHGTYWKLNNGKEQMKPRKNVNVKQNVNEYIGYEILALNDVETPMMEIFKHTFVYET